VNDMFAIVMALPLVVLIGGLILGGMALQHRAKLQELAYRERIAMIERGLAPPPETDPSGFDRAFSAGAEARLTAPGERAMRHRTAGVALLAFGLGLMMIITFAGDNPGAGVGVGGAIMVVGAAGLINSYFIAQDEARRAADERRRAALAPPAPPAPPAPRVDPTNG